MTQEEKELLLKDLLGRVLYGVKVDYHTNIFTLGYNLYLNNGDVAFENYPMLYSLENIESVKPYLRPLSSMMQGEWQEMTALIYPYGRINGNPNNKNELLLWLSAEENDMPIMLMDNVFSWLDKNMFDYHDLIPMGLALEAPEGMYE